MEDPRGPVLGGAGVLAGVAAALLTVVHGHRWLSILIIVVLVISVVVVIAALISYGRSWFTDWRSKANRDPEPVQPLTPTPGSPFTALWRYTTDGGEAASAARALQKGVSHPGYSRDYDEQPCKVVLAVLVPCDPLKEVPATSSVVKAFLDLLCGPVVGKLISTLTYVEGGASWYSYATNGPLNNQAILSSMADEAAPPVASAILNLNNSSVGYQLFQDPQRAELVVGIEPRGESGLAPIALTLAQWHAWLQEALKLPEALGRFVAEEIHVATYADPEVQVGVWLEGHTDLTDLIEAGDVEAPPGMGRTRTFPIYFVGDRGGKKPSLAAHDALRGCCDYGLHVHGYETQLRQLGGTP